MIKERLPEWMFKRRKKTVPFRRGSAVRIVMDPRSAIVVETDPRVKVRLQGGETIVETYIPDPVGFAFDLLLAAGVPELAHPSTWPSKMSESAFIQEWPGDKLTLSELREVCRALTASTDVLIPDLNIDALSDGESKLRSALAKAEEGVEPARKALGPVYFFGCTKGVYGSTQAGHYLYIEGPEHEREPRKAKDWLGKGILPKSDLSIDGDFCPHYAKEKRYGKAKLTHWGGWTAVGFWDSSGDTRPGSDTNFFIKGTLDFEDAMEEARRVFGPVIERCEKRYGDPIECVQEVVIPVAL